MIDSFGFHTLRGIAELARLRGAETVIFGIQPDVALAMVQLGMGPGPVSTAADLEEGAAYLEGALGSPHPGREHPEPHHRAVTDETASTP